jgi:hypothetical protein
MMDQPVKSFDTKLCSEGQAGVTVLLLDIVYGDGVDAASLPSSLAVKMHGPGVEQRMMMGGLGLYSKEAYMYNEFNMGESLPVVTPKVFGIWYDTRESYETMQMFNLVMENLNENYDAYNMFAKVPNQAEWDDMFIDLGKLHAKYWDSPEIYKPPLAIDDTKEFKLGEMETACALSVSTRVDSWFAAIEKHCVPYNPDAMTEAQPFLEIMDMWRGDDGAKLFTNAMKRLKNAPMTLLHGDFNPGNVSVVSKCWVKRCTIHISLQLFEQVWKGKTGGAQAGKYLTADWQVTRMGPAAWDFVTATAGMEPGESSVIATMKTYHANLEKVMEPAAYKAFTYDVLEENFKCSFIAFMQYIFAVVYTSMVTAAELGEMDKGKMEYTYDKFLPALLRRAGMAARELNLIAFQKELLAEQ